MFIEHIYRDFLSLIAILTVLILDLFSKFLIADFLPRVKLIWQKFQIRLFFFFCLQRNTKLILMMVLAQRTELLVDQRRISQIVHWYWTAVSWKRPFPTNDWNLCCSQFSYFSLGNGRWITPSLSQQHGRKLLSLHVCNYLMMIWWWWLLYSFWVPKTLFLFVWSFIKFYNL